MIEINIDIKGLERAINKLKATPRKLDRNLRAATGTALSQLWESVRPYPPEPPQSQYDRTVMLGRSLGVYQSGSKSGTKPSIYQIKGTGKNVTGYFGTNLSYAKYVVDPDRQAYMHKGRWWTMASIKRDALPKIKKAFYQMVSKVLGK